MDPQDALFNRLVEHYRNQGQLSPGGRNSGGEEAKTRRAFIRGGDGTIGLLEIESVNSAEIESSRRLTWTRNARLNASDPPAEGDRGSTLREIATWDDALALIDGKKISP